MVRYKQHTIAELLKRAQKLHRPVMTSILEGKDLMQGPLDELDNDIDLRALQICGNCRNHLDLSMSQDCSICNRGYHSFCLEVPLNSTAIGVRCCYDCQQQAVYDYLSHTNDNELEERFNKFRLAEGLERTGTSYASGPQSSAANGMDVDLKESSPKLIDDSDGAFSEFPYKPSKVRAARKLGIRRKRISEDGYENSSIQTVISDTDTSKFKREESGSILQQNTDDGKVLVESDGRFAKCCQASLDDSKTSNCTAAPSVYMSKGESDLGKLETQIEQALKGGIVLRDNGTQEMTVIDKPLHDTKNGCANLQEEFEDEMGEKTPFKNLKLLNEVMSQTAGSMQIIAEDQLQKSISPSSKKAAQARDIPEVALQDTSGKSDHLPTAHRTTVTEGNTVNKRPHIVCDPVKDEKMRNLAFLEEKPIAGTLCHERLHEDQDGSSLSKGGRKEIPPKDHVSHTDSIENKTSSGPEANSTSLGSPSSTPAIEDEVKVCDICGDAGYEDMLAICSDCGGAEHVYCFQRLTGQVPEGYWQCEVCRMKQKACDSRPFADSRVSSPLLPRSPSFNSNKKQSNVKNARSRLSALLQKRKLQPEKKRALKGIPSSQLPTKRASTEDILDAPAPKKQAVEISTAAHVSSPKIGLSREASFKSSDTGKIKFVSHASLTGIGSDVAQSSRAISRPVNSHTSQGGQTPKARTSNLVVNVPANRSTKLIMTPPGIPSVTVPGLKSSKSNDPLPSFLLSSKPHMPKFQASMKNPKDAQDSVGLQGFQKEGLSGHAGATNRTLVKANSFKISKPPVPSILPMSARTDNNLASTRASENKFESVVTSTIEAKSKVPVLLDLNSSVEGLHGNYMNNSGKSVKPEFVNNLPGRNVLSRHEIVNPVGQGRSEPSLPHQFPFQDDKKFSVQTLVPATFVKMKNKYTEKPGSDHLTQVSQGNTDTDGMHSLAPAPDLETIAKEPPSKVLQLSEFPGDKPVSPLVDLATTHEESRNAFTPRSQPFCGWGSPGFLPSLGLTRCYRCKVLGHTARDCIYRGSLTSIPSDSGGFKAMPVFNVDSAGPATLPPTSNGDSYIPFKKISYSCVSDNYKSDGTAQNEEAACISKTITEASAPEVDLSVQQKSSLLDEKQNQLQEEKALESSSSLPLCAAVTDHIKARESEDSKGVNSEQAKPQDEVSLATKERHEPSGSISIKKEDTSTPMCLDDPNALDPPSATAILPTECQIAGISIPHVLKSQSSFPSPMASSTIKCPISSVTRCQDSPKVYPEAQIVWQGTFDVGGKGKPQVLVKGLQANPSNRALPKVREVSKKLQSCLPLEELPRGTEHNSWPISFQKSPPINDNIALYFFASTKESYTQYYKPLVDRLIKLDLVLKSLLEDAELLIFPSNLLPPGSQCWNNFMFLWAVFRDRKLPIRQPILLPSFSGAKQPGISANPKLQIPALTSWVGGDEMQAENSPSKHSEPILTVDGRTESQNSTAVQLPSRQPILLGTTSNQTSSVSGTKQPGTTASPKLQIPALSSCVGGDEMQVEISPTKCIEPSKPDIDHKVASEEQSSRQGLPSLIQVGETHKKESFDSQTSKDQMLHLSEDAAVANSSPALEDVSAIKNQLPTSTYLENVIAETADGLPVTELPEQRPGNIAEGDNCTSAVNIDSILPGNSDKLRRETPLVANLPASVPSPREKQEDALIPRKLAAPSSHSPHGNQDRDKRYIRDRAHDKSRDIDRLDSGRGLNRDRDRERPREREKYRDKEKERERPRRHTEWEREKERDRSKDRERDRDRDRDRTRERERDRERWRERNERDRCGRDWEKVGEREKLRDRAREREPDRERILGRDRTSRYRHWDSAETEHLRGSRHWNRYPRSRSPSRSPPSHRDWSPAQRFERYHNRYHRSFRQSRSYSRSPDSGHGLSRLQPRADSQELSKDSFARKGKSPDVMTTRGESTKRLHEKDSAADDQGNFSQRGSNSDSLCRENTVGSKEWKLPVADLNLSPDIEGNEGDDVTMPIESSRDDSRYYSQFFPSSLPSTSNGDIGECSNSTDRVLSYHTSADHISESDKMEFISPSVRNDFIQPSSYQINVPTHPSSCIQFLPRNVEDASRAINTPDLNLALGAKGDSPPRPGEMQFMQLLEPCQETTTRSLSFSDVSLKMAEQADLSLSLAIPEHSKKPLVNTSLRLFG